MCGRGLTSALPPPRLDGKHQARSAPRLEPHALVPRGCVAWSLVCVTAARIPSQVAGELVGAPPDEGQRGEAESGNAGETNRDGVVGEGAGSGVVVVARQMVGPVDAGSPG